MSTKTKVKKGMKAVEEAKNNLIMYLQLQQEKASIDASMKELKAGLEMFAHERRHQFDENNNYHFEGVDGYLKFSESSVVVQGKTFDIKRFMRAFPECVQTSLKTAAVKKLILDGDQRRKLERYDVDMKQVESFTIVKGD